MKLDNFKEYADGDSDFLLKCIAIQRNLTPVHPREATFIKVVGSISDGSIIAKE